MSDRYTDKPFLRFVDAWVLKAIGHLDAATETWCKAMVPQLEQSFGVRGSWEQIVAQQMKFGPECPRRSGKSGPTARRDMNRAMARRPTRANLR